jgi:hypothetical protein
MATQTDPSRQPHKSRASSDRQPAQNAQPEIVSSTVTKVSRLEAGLITDEQRRELIATIWREIYGPSAHLAGPRRRPRA